MNSKEFQNGYKNSKIKKAADEAARKDAELDRKLRNSQRANNQSSNNAPVVSTENLEVNDIISVENIFDMPSARGSNKLTLDNLNSTGSSAINQDNLDAYLSKRKNDITIGDVSGKSLIDSQIENQPSLPATTGISREKTDKYQEKRQKKEAVEALKKLNDIVDILDICIPNLGLARDIVTSSSKSNEYYAIVDKSNLSEEEKTELKNKIKAIDESFLKIELFLETETPLQSDVVRPASKQILDVLSYTKTGVSFSELTEQARKNAINELLTNNGIQREERKEKFILTDKQKNAINEVHPLLREFTRKMTSEYFHKTNIANERKEKKE